MTSRLVLVLVCVRVAASRFRRWFGKQPFYQWFPIGRLQGGEFVR